MRETAVKSEEQFPRIAKRRRYLATGTLYAALQIFPKLLPRRNPPSWMTFRVALGVCGAALVVLPLNLWEGWVVSLVGLGVFSTAILLPPARVNTTTDDKARELGAVTVVNGGEYQPGNAPAAAVRLFIGRENIWALDKMFQPQLVIPTADLAALDVMHHGGTWKVRAGWNEHAAEFCYHGVFAEHLARLAESAIRCMMRNPLPRRRAAGA